MIFHNARKTSWRQASFLLSFKKSFNFDRKVPESILNSIRLKQSEVSQKSNVKSGKLCKTKKVKRI